ncbi:MAG: hypothetical protein K1X67_12540 [Fimbriimonadaceae bacterium]|nr:hypothetical protein [Fimbriimonadaceae bacterium]
MTHGIHIDRQALLRRAAEMGPGHRGKRDPSNAVERSALATALSDEAPAYLHTEHTWIDRRAKLFEAGEYPDKGLASRRRCCGPWTPTSICRFRS